MSSTRLSISNELIDALKQLHQASLTYQKEHTTDGLYHLKLLKPLREKYNDAWIDFNDEFETNLMRIERAGENAQANLDSFNFQVTYAGSIPVPIAKLTYCSELLKTAFVNDVKKQDTCDVVINELNSLSNHIQEILLIGYKNHFNTLLTLLNKLGTAPQQYKHAHQTDLLYEEALIKPCKFLMEAKLDFVQDLLENCKEIQSHAKEFEEKAADTSRQLVAVKKLDNSVCHLLEELSLFKKAPKADDTDQKAYEEAIIDLKHLKLLTERLCILKPNRQ